MNTEFFENKIIIKNADGFDLKKRLNAGSAFALTAWATPSRESPAASC